MIKENMASCIGNTPLVRLSKVFSDSDVTVLAKLELMNPGGSIKDRPAMYMLDAGVQTGTIKHDSHIIESSSGNLAIALAMICKMKGLNFTAVVDPKISPTNLKILKLFDANIVIVSEKDENDGYLLTRINTVKQLLKSIRKAVWINQYANPDNWRSHYYGEGSEILNQIDQKIDYLVIGASTSGTLMGVSRRLKEAFPDMKVIAVDIIGSVLFGGKSEPREIPGIGASRVPELLSINEVDQVVYVDDFESALGCRRLIAEEGIFAGGSSGSVISAIEKILPNIPAGKCVLTLLPDRGDRYLDLVYDDSWFKMVRERHFNKQENIQQKDPIE
ncbi:2,3-diaminopropionate biosynthesis protein SbnA [Marinomonas sp. UCMA 3892]|uniref:2,3-diaminopropionate biosynthesis protein SbnA n=1 Tax=unclassified Marinomonas TaxID=196814 RepID=UPI000C1ED7D2|nr:MULTISPECIES: 2,3-diaminopropionate biosynthesis protein SbnA [unclassified Marinomonas]NLU99026.1 2,3-diaminopropionate biosynthesis protein SbnA [Marinomonas sp. UCMA 3892]PJE53600.1 siderophore biosynthesis protein SbnA [Marinomonas sp. BSi20584]